MAEDIELNKLFIDKLRLSAAILEKEGQLAGAFASLMKKIRCGYVSIENVDKCNEYDNSWRLVYELYIFMKHNKIEELKDKLEEEYGDLIDVMKKYSNPDEKLNFFDLKNSVDIITKFISKAGYHDDKIKKEEGDLESEET